MVSSLPLHPGPEARPATMPWTEPGWEWARQTRALPMRPGHRRAEPDTGRFSELNGGPLFLAARSILGITGGRRQLRGRRVGWGTAGGRKREDRAWRGCVKAPPPTGPDVGGGGGNLRGSKEAAWAYLPFILASSLARPTQQAGTGHPNSKTSWQSAAQP